MVSGGVGGDPFEALGDPNRREILRLLSDGDKPVQQIAAAMPISRPAVSRHLRLLKPKLRSILSPFCRLSWMNGYLLVQ